MGCFFFTCPHLSRLFCWLKLAYTPCFDQCCNKYITSISLNGPLTHAWIPHTWQQRSPAPAFTVHLSIHTLCGCENIFSCSLFICLHLLPPPHSASPVYRESAPAAATHPLHPRCRCGWWLRTHSPPHMCSCPCLTARHSPWSGSSADYAPVCER